MWRITLIQLCAVYIVAAACWYTPEGRLQLPGLTTGCYEAAPNRISRGEVSCCHVLLQVQRLISHATVRVRLDERGVGVFISLLTRQVCCQPMFQQTACYSLLDGFSKLHA